MTDNRLQELLRAAMPPAGDADPRRDLWPAVAERLDRGTGWSMLDLGLAAAVAVTLLMFPEWLFVLVYHL